MLTLAVCGNVLTITTFMVFNAWRAEFKSFNLGGDLTSEEDVANSPIKVVLVTFLSGASAALFIFVAMPMVSVFGKHDEISLYDPLTLLGCFLAGLVSISASCGNVSNEASILIGVIGTIFFMIGKKLMIKFEVDDGLNQVSIHMVCGVWSLIAAGIFDSKQGTLATGSV